MGIKLGDNNKFEGPTNIGKDNTIKVEKNSNEKTSWFAKHPLITTVLGGLLVIAIGATVYWKSFIKFVGSLGL
ncbi:hypothetical protein QYM23_12545 [Bacillus cereus]|uniref:Uncharacterized protein n=1 Tax=Bacillus cereus TaxID=1396 RepID=A0AAW7NGP5_BACCE|nr:hypothetical protein [Bacillus cereus]MDN4873683.1 hypothetical protein [Bacillus cereus]